jgi:hypothetical protein
MSANQLVYSNEMDDVEEYDDIEDPDFERTAWKGTFNAPYSSLEEAENKIILLSQYPYNKTKFDYYDEFIDFLTKEPASISYQFERIKQKLGVDIKTSDDGKLRMYGWDNGTGGTCIFYTNVFQYVCGDSVFTKVCSLPTILSGKDCEIAGGGSEPTKIYTLTKPDGTTLYLLKFWYRMWSFHFGETLYAVTIKNDSLVATPLFSTAEGLKSEWDVKYRYSEGDADYERVILDKAIYMDWENKQMYIPQVESKEEEYSTEEFFVTGRYDCYYFNGEVFEYKDTQENLFFLTTN